MGVVTRAQAKSLHLAKIKIKEFLETHPLLPTPELRLRNVVQLLNFLSSSEASGFVCRYGTFGYAVVEKLSELTSDGLCPKLAAHYFREIFEKRVSRLQYPLPPDIQIRRETCLCEPDPATTTLCYKSRNSTQQFDFKIITIKAA